MPIFTYTARAGAKQTKGEIEAADKNAAVEQLRTQRLLVINITEKAAGQDSIFKRLNPFKNKIKGKDLVIFSRQLSTLVSAGVPIVQGFNILTQQIENEYFKGVVSQVKDDIESGASIAESMEKHPKVFSELFVNLIKAGELGGILDVILVRLADYAESADELKAKVKGAMVYPAVISIVAISVTLFLLIFIIPTFATTFESFGKELPLPTQVMINISNFLRQYIGVILVVPVGLYIGIKRFYKTEAGQREIDRRLLDLPVFGPLLRKVAIAKFTRTFGTLVKSGVPILEALDTVAHTSGNKIIEMAVISARESIREGGKIAEQLGISGVFPPMVMQMISVGEETGNLDIMLSKIADFYDAEVDTAVEALTSMIEPLIIVFLGVVVGSIVLAMFLPIFDMSSLVE